MAGDGDRRWRPAGGRTREEEQGPQARTCSPKTNSNAGGRPRWPTPPGPTGSAPVRTDRLPDSDARYRAGSGQAPARRQGKPDRSPSRGSRPAPSESQRASPRRRPLDAGERAVPSNASTAAPSGCVRRPSGNQSDQPTTAGHQGAADQARRDHVREGPDHGRGPPARIYEDDGRVDAGADRRTWPIASDQSSIP